VVRLHSDTHNGDTNVTTSHDFPNPDRHGIRSSKCPNSGGNGEAVRSSVAAMPWPQRRDTGARTHTHTLTHCSNT
jgi:hypothetical protein